MTTDTGGRAQQTASTAAGEGQHVASVAASEAKSVAGEAAQQAKGVAGQALGQVQGTLDEQARTQKDRLTTTLGSLGDDLHRMAEQADSGLATDLTREIGDRVHAVSSHLSGREPSELLDDVRRFARQRPGTFLLGALAAGVVVGRLARGTRDGAVAASADTDSTGSTGLGSTGTSAPLAATPGAELGSESGYSAGGVGTTGPSSDPLSDPLDDPLAGPGSWADDEDPTPVTQPSTPVDPAVVTDPGGPRL